MSSTDSFRERWCNDDNEVSPLNLFRNDVETPTTKFKLEPAGAEVSARPEFVSCSIERYLLKIIACKAHQISRLHVCSTFSLSLICACLPKLCYVCRLLVTVVVLIVVVAFVLRGGQVLLPKGL